MSSFHLILWICVFVIVAILMISAMSPNTVAQKRRKKELPREQEGKDWEQVAVKLEKHILSLRAELEKQKNQEKRILKELDFEKDKNIKLQEKLQQEKEWLTKEQESITKWDHEARELKQNLLKAQDDLEKEHFTMLKLEQQLKEMKQDLEAVSKEKRELSLKMMKLESELEYYRKELAQQKKINQELTKENDEANWVAKSEYDRVVKLLQERERKPQDSP